MQLEDTTPVTGNSCRLQLGLISQGRPSSSPYPRCGRRPDEGQQLCQGNCWLQSEAVRPTAFSIMALLKLMKKRVSARDE